MSSEAPADAPVVSAPVADTPAPVPPAPDLRTPSTLARRMQRAFAWVAVAGLVCSVVLWQKLNNIQEQLARQTGDANTLATEARAAARQSQDMSLDTAAKLALLETRLSEVALQRTQLEELIQSLSRSRDENLVVDIESAIRLAQQQAQLTGSVEPLLAALKTADVRVSRAAQPRLTPLQRAIAKDVARIKATALADTPALLLKLDELTLLMDDVPVANAVPLASTEKIATQKAKGSVAGWWERTALSVRDELRNLVRVSRVDEPEAALLSPEQSFFVRENLKLRLLNARLGLLSRQIDTARSDLATASVVLRRYFDAGSRTTQTADALLQQVQGQMKLLELPRVDDTLAALSTAAAGR